MNRIALGLAAALYAAPVSAGPFGLDQGMPTSQLNVRPDVESKDNTFTLASVPKPHSAFEFYFAQSSDATGLCFVRAVTFDFENDRYGQNVRREFEKLKDQLDKSYDNGELFDHLKRDSIWDEQRDWVMAIQQNERDYQASWSKNTGFTGKDGINEILLTVVALGSDKSYVSLQYRFDNYDQCKAALESNEAGAL